MVTVLSHALCISRAAATRQATRRDSSASSGSCTDHSVSSSVISSYINFDKGARDGDGPSRELWQPATPSDRTNEGGRELARGLSASASGSSSSLWSDAGQDLGWVPISHSPRVRSNMLWMYAAANSSVWYNAGRAFVVQDAVDVFRWMDVRFSPPGTAQKAAVLKSASARLKRLGFDTLVFLSHIDGCNATLLPILAHGCWARGKRVVELVSLHPFRETCPVSSRFRRGMLLSHPQDGPASHAPPPAMGPASTRTTARLCACSCTEATRSPYDVRSRGQVIC